jgi:hypothetical protein
MAEVCTPNGPYPAYNVYAAPSTIPFAIMGFTLTGMWDEPSLRVDAIFQNNGRSFTIARQDFGPNHEFESLGGTVSADGDSITLTYTVYAGSTSNIVETCTGTMVRF